MVRCLYFDSDTRLECIVDNKLVVTSVSLREHSVGQVNSDAYIRRHYGKTVALPSASRESLLSRWITTDEDREAVMECSDRRDLGICERGRKTREQSH